MTRSESIGKLAGALSKVQGAMHAAQKSATNPFFKSKYADLESVWEAIRKPLADNELSVSQLTEYNDEAKTFCIETVIMHSSGEFISGVFPLITKDQSPQAMGSATSYARRYALSAALGVIASDDDGNAAEARHEPRSEPRSQLTPHPVSPDDPADYVPLFGKFSGRKLRDIAPSELENYVLWLESNAKKKGETIKSNVQSFIDAVALHLNSIEQPDDLPMDWK